MSCALTNSSVLPNFIIIGAGKSGTTTLYSLLKEHPMIYMSDPKEPKYFSSNFSNGLSWYQSFFHPGKRFPAIGEASPNYTMRDTFPDVVPRMQQLIPDVKLIYIMRHPIDRIVSNWKMYCQTHSSDLDINTAVFQPEFRYFLIDRSRYHYQLEPYLKCFPRTQLLLLTLDDLSLSPRDTLKKCFAFIDVDPDFSPPSIHSKKNAYSPIQTENQSTLARLLRGFTRRTASENMTLLPETRSRLAHILRQDAELALGLCGKPTTHWKL